MANVWEVDYNSSLDSSKIRSSTGIAVNWFTPIGPLSFSLSQPIHQYPSDLLLRKPAGGTNQMPRMRNTNPPRRLDGGRKPIATSPCRVQQV